MGGKALPPSQLFSYVEAASEMDMMLDSLGPALSPQEADTGLGQQVQTQAPTSDSPAWK